MARTKHASTSNHNVRAQLPIPPQRKNAPCCPPRLARRPHRKNSPAFDPIPEPTSPADTITLEMPVFSSSPTTQQLDEISLDVPPAIGKDEETKEDLEITSRLVTNTYHNCWFKSQKIWPTGVYKRKYKLKIKKIEYELFDEENPLAAPIEGFLEDTDVLDCTLKAIHQTVVSINKPE